MAQSPKIKVGGLGNLDKVQTKTPIDIAGNIEKQAPPSQTLVIGPPVKNLWSGKGQVLIRPDDLLSMRVELLGLELVPGGGNAPAMLKANADATLVVHFQPQSIAEETTETSGQTVFKPPPEMITGLKSAQLTLPTMQARLAGESRLAFRVKAGQQIPYTVEGILHACQTLPLQLADNALPLPVTAADLRPFLIVDKPINTLQRASASQKVLKNARSSGQFDQVNSANRFTPAKLDKTKFPQTAIVPLAPKPEHSALELPWRLLISPTPGAHWLHSLLPVRNDPSQRIELWHSILNTAAVDTLRAIWATTGVHPEDGSRDILPDFPNGPNNSLPDSAAVVSINKHKANVPFLAPLNDADRLQLVHLSSNFSRTRQHAKRGQTLYTPLPMKANLLGLSTLGGWLNLRGAWNPLPLGYALSEWRHRSTQARDHAVRVAYVGVLFPFGHQATLIKDTERKFVSVKTPLGLTVRREAKLFTRYYLVIKEPERHYHGQSLIDANKTHLELAWPFSSVRLLTTVTPDVDPPGQGIGQVGSASTQDLFFPVVNNQRFAFDYEAKDRDGRQLRFSAPAIFMSALVSSPKTKTGGPDWALAELVLKDASVAWDSKVGPLQFNRQAAALAESGVPGDTLIEIETLTVNAAHSAVPIQQAVMRGYSNNLQSPAFYPQLKEASVVLPVTAQLTGNTKPSTLNYADYYLKNGFNDNHAGLFAELKNATGLDFSKQGDRSGGFVMPNLTPSAITRVAGPVAGQIQDWQQGKFDPVSALAGGGGLPLPVLFGCIPLSALIEKVADVAGKPAGVPRFISEASDALQQLLNQLNRLQDLSGQLAELPALLVNAAVKALFSTLEDLKQQALAQVSVHQQALTVKLNNLQGKLQSLANALQIYATAAQQYAENAQAAKPSLDSVKIALTDVPGLLSDLASYAAHPPAPAPALPSGLTQSLQLAAVTGQRLLEDANALVALAQAVPPLLDKLRGKLDNPAQLEQLLAKPADFTNWIGELKPHLQDARNAVSGMRLLEGPPQTMMLAAADFVIDLAEHADVLASLLASLLGDEIVVRFDWHPALKSFPANAPIFRVNEPECMTVAVEARIKKAGGDPSLKVSCALRHFDLVLIGDAAFIELNFDKIEFTADPSAKPNIDVLLSDIKFVGPLSFVEALRDLIPLDGFSDPPYLDVSAKGIDAGFSTTLPNLPLGMFSLSNMSLGAGFTVPFIGEPLSVRFNFCTREQPFNLTVSMFGGGGFFGITLDPSGIQILEAAFEFGACVSMNFGVASGGVHAMAGIYFRMENDNATLAGYFRVGGHVSVLAIASVSLELYLELRYETATGKAAGFAKLTIEVSVFMFSFPVTVECERKFAGSNGDPSFRELLGPDAKLSQAASLLAIDDQTAYPWREYCEAFAA